MYKVCLTVALLVAGAPCVADPATEMRSLGNCAECVIDGGDFADARMMGIDLSRSDLRGASFARARMSVAVLDGARLTDVSFAGAELRGATFVNARLSNVDFTGADLTGAVFEGAVLEGSDLAAGRLCQTQMPDDEIANTNCGDR